jgi:hypothetical protein
METQGWGTGNIDSTIWNTAHRRLNYIKQPFNNKKDMIRWKREGYTQANDAFTGLLYDMRFEMPTWVAGVTEHFEQKYKLNDIGTSVYKMPTGTVLPVHRDTYSKYRELFNCKVSNIFRAVVFLESWSSGHYFEVNGTPFVDWVSGDYCWWYGNTAHMAANIGVKPRYTLQITGHVDDTK